MCADPAPNGANGVSNAPHHANSPYQSVGDYLSNVKNFKIIESTLREGEQFANSYFDTGKFSAAGCDWAWLTCE